MWQDISFKVCIILSTCIHIAVLYPRPLLRLMSKPEITFKRIELTYLKEGGIKEVLVKSSEPITSIRQKSEKTDIETTKLEKVEIVLKQSPKAKIEKIKEEKEDILPEIPEDSERKKTDTVKTVSGDTGIREDYCLRVREKIKSALEKNRRHFTKDGEIHVRFAITRDGILKNLTVDKRTDKNIRQLVTIALESIKKASPFPPFSDKMDENELLFKLPIRFTCHP